MKTLEALLKTSVSRPEQGTILLILTIASRLETCMQQFLKKFGIGLEQYNVLRILRGQNGHPLQAVQIAERMVNANSNVTRLIDKLEAKDLVKRVACPHDRRAIWLNITEKGLKLLKQIDEEMQGGAIFPVPAPATVTLLNEHLDQYLNQILTHKNEA